MLSAQIQGAAGAARAVDKLSAVATYLDGLSGLMWPIIVAVLLWRLWPVLRMILQSRRITIKIGGFELSAHEASAALHAQFDDVQPNLLQARRRIGVSAPRSRSQSYAPRWRRRSRRSTTRARRQRWWRLPGGATRDRC